MGRPLLRAWRISTSVQRDNDATTAVCVLDRRVHICPRHAGGKRPVCPREQQSKKPQSVTTTPVGRFVGGLQKSPSCRRTPSEQKTPVVS
jgi:hypothetical protein